MCLKLSTEPTYAGFLYNVAFLHWAVLSLETRSTLFSVQAEMGVAVFKQCYVFLNGMFVFFVFIGPGVFIQRTCQSLPFTNKPH